MRTLFLRIDPTATEASWQLIDNTQPVGPVGRGNLRDAMRPAHHAHVVVLVPTEDVFVNYVELPGKNRQKLLKALPFAVEDQLVEDVENMHFALSPHSINGRYLVTAVEEKMLDYWQSALRAAGIHVEAMMPDVLALPGEGAWTVLLEPDRALVRTPFGMFASDVENLPLLLTNLYQQAAADKPDAITVYDCGRANHIATLQALTTDMQFNVQSCAEGVLGVVAKEYSSRDTVNLLQGDYGVERNLKKYFKPWLTAGSLFLVWMAWQLSFNIFNYLKLNSQSTDLDAQVAQVYKAAFPTGKKPSGISERNDMERRLKELRKQQGAGGGGLSEMLVQTGPVLKEMQGMNIKSLRYVDGRMDIELSIKSSSELDPLKDRISKQTGLSVEVQQASSKGDQTDVRLQIKRKG